MERHLHQQQQKPQRQQEKQAIVQESSTIDVRRIFQVDEGHRSKQTATKYKTNFNHFLTFIRIHDLDVFLDLGKEAIQELVIKYVLSMRDNPDKRYSRNTVNNRVTAILYFLDNNDIELNKRKVRRYFPSDESVNDDRPYTTEEVQRILAVSDLRSKAMILLMVSSGIRVGSLSSMQVADLTKIEFQKSILYKVQVYARTRDKYYTFCTPECYNAIQEYLNFRKRYGEEIKDDSKSPLIREQFNKDNQFTINVPKHLTANAIMKIIDECLKRSGVKTSEARRNHAFRKGFKSICEQSAMKSINVEMLLGHDIGVSGHYYRPAERDILEDYMTHAADALTIDPTHRLKQENAELKKNQSDYLVELGDLRHDFNEMKQLLVHLNKESQKQLVDEFFQKVGDKADIEWSCND
jgi:integrase